MGATGIGTGKDAQVVDAKGMQQVEFAMQPLTVAAFALRGEDGSIPHVGAYVVIGHVVQHEAAALYRHEVGGAGCGEVE